MITFKQLEALYWIDRLGGFAPAARRLHTTQSAISKRVQELEAALNVDLFDRSLRSARLSEKGAEVLALAERLLAERDAALEQIARPEVISRRLRLGVTELTAMTWFPRLVQAITARFPRVTLEPDVDLSVNLRDKLLEGEVDLIVVPDAFADARFTRTRLAEVESAWMCKPGLVPARRKLAIAELGSYPLLTQGEMSGTGLVYDRWLRSVGVPSRRVINSSSLVALIGMAVAGLGVTYLPHRCLRGMVEDGLLAIVRADPPLPVVPYVAMQRGDQKSALVNAVVALAREQCDFGQLFQAQGGPRPKLRPRRRKDC